MSLNVAQIIKEKGKEIVGNGPTLKTPTIATSSIDVHVTSLLPSFHLRII